MTVNLFRSEKGRSEDSISFDSFEKGKIISPVEEIDLILSLPRKDQM